jgi:lipid II:glycine glycyltransferase (peptidoglycan interpeptide bridge formation enzyme)
MISPSFFQTILWFEVLNKGFGAHSHRLNDSLAVTFFRAGPLCVTYANFPVGIRSPDVFETIMGSQTQHRLKDMGTDLLRFSVPGPIAQEHFGKGIHLPETSIQSLSDWSEEKLDGEVRYEIRRSRREGIKIRPASQSDAYFMFTLYGDTVKRHEGRIRYTQSYFEAICKLTQSVPDISGLIAETAEGIPCGFIVTAQSGKATYYLHAGFDLKYASGRPSYALLCKAITQARDNGSCCFNLMASPAGQAELIRFKEKWRGHTQPLVNFDIPVSKFGHIAHLGLQVFRYLPSSQQG